MRRNPALPLSAQADAPGQAVDAPVDASAIAPAAVALGRRLRKNPELSSTSSPSPETKHQVFLSFSGTDACQQFANRLYGGLIDVGMRVLRGHNELLLGENISLELKEVIKRSRASIVILSTDYASSKRCLDELAQMWECRKMNGLTIIPIFYGVSSSDVRFQAGDFGRSFNLHEMVGVDSNTIETWRKVLRLMGKFSGYSRKSLDGPDSQLVKEVVAGVVRVLKSDGQIVTYKLVGIDLRVREMMRKLGVAYSNRQATKVQGEEVRVVGMWGVPGVGKTTLAKIVFNKIRNLFDACCFLEDISSEEVQYSRHMLIADLQKRRLAPLESTAEGIEEIMSLCHNAKTLIVIDNVDKEEQIKALAGKLTWFGPGSRIIVTTNNKKVFNAFEVGADDGGTVEEHEVIPMGRDHAHKLFCKHAFEGAAAASVSEYFGLSMKIAQAIGGLPSDIVDHASYLRRNMKVDTWKSTLELLGKRSKNKVALYAGGLEVGNFTEDNQLSSPIQDLPIETEYTVAQPRTIT
ncbi:hypothetical protein BT93_E1282 [Corymbia citriodora subsp. variegata]|nr:hypothetical protein BT93_E1282 [Corymbia citriodora subsp. variegata]